MDLRTYRAKSMQEALALVRRELGPDAAVLHTREVRDWRTWLGGRHEIEVTASTAVHVPSRLTQASDRRAGPTRNTPHAVQPDLNSVQPEPERSELAASELSGPCEAAESASEVEDFGANNPCDVDPPSDLPAAETSTTEIQPAHEFDYRSRFREDLKGQLDHLHSMLEELSSRPVPPATPEMPAALFDLFTDLIDAEFSEELARDLVSRIRSGAEGNDLEDALVLKSRLTRLLESEVTISGPIQVEPGTRRLVALVGPTGVGKTTTIAKLAANFHLRENCRVALVTVDTYRIAAVEQLRTYAEIIDLPMEVVSSRREMREAVDRFHDFDLVLLDTAGRSPRDEIQLQELKSILQEAQPDEVHLVLASVASEAALKKTADRFRRVGTSALILTKLDEATGLGSLLPLLRSCGLPLSYLTHGQNVPDDIEAAKTRSLVRRMLNPVP